MASVEEVITELRKLTPEQVDEAARIIRELSRAECPEAVRHPAVPPSVIDQAVQHGWPAQLFTEVIGSLPDLERVAQPPVGNRAGL